MSYRDSVSCPFKKSDCKEQYSRNKLYNHLLSKHHHEELKAKIKPRLSLFLRSTTKMAAYFETETGFISFCCGCQKAWTLQKNTHFETCELRSVHQKELERRYKDAEPTPDEAGSEAQAIEIDTLKMKIAALEKNLEKAQKDLELQKEMNEEDSDNATLYWQLLKVIVGLPGRVCTDDFKEVADDIKEGKAKSLTELREAPPSAPPPPPPPARPFLPAGPPQVLMSTKRAVSVQRAAPV